MFCLSVIAYIYTFSDDNTKLLSFSLQGVQLKLNHLVNALTDYLVTQKGVRA